MTREEILSDYRTENGIIRSPGKFEAEPIYVPHFWSLALEGGADEDTDEGGVSVFVFALTDEDRTEWPELGDARSLRLYESDTGFVYSRTE